MTMALVLSLLCTAPEAPAAAAAAAPEAAPAPEVAAAPNAPAVGANPVDPESTLTQKDLAYRIGKNLRCPVCQGMSIAESPSTMAQDMMKGVRRMLAEGKSEQEVNDYFIDRYGEWVLLAPPSGGFGIWVWVLPPVFVLGALAMLVRWVRKLRATKAVISEEPGISSPPPAAAATPVSGDAAYLQAIRDEVQR